MATIPPIEVKALWDATQLAAGTAATVTDITGVSDAVDRASTDINTSLATVGDTAETELGTRLPEAADTAAVGLTTKSSKFKAVGSELGQTLTDSVASGVEAPAAAANMGQALSGLLAASATTGAGIAAAVGIGLAVAIVKGITNGAKERKQEVIDAYNSLFSSIEVKAKQSAKEIKASILDAFDFQAVITKFGDDDIDAGFARINELVQLTGKSFNEITLFLQRGVTPATQETADAVREVYENGQTSTAVHGKMGVVLNDNAKISGELLRTAEENNAEQSKLLEQKRREVDFLNATELSNKQSAKYVGDMVGTSAQVVQNMAAAAYQAERLGGALGNAVRQSSLMDIALGG